MASRTKRNIMVSLDQADRPHRRQRCAVIDSDSAWYAVFWSALILGLHTEPLASHEYIYALFTHISGSFPVDVGLVDMILPLLGPGLREDVTTRFKELKDVDNMERTPQYRFGVENVAVQFKVGHCFRHKRYHYDGFIVGWDARCSATDDWIHQMDLHTLPRGKFQPFYYVMYGLEKVPCLAKKKYMFPKEKEHSQSYSQFSNPPSPWPRRTSLGPLSP